MSGRSAILDRSSNMPVGGRHAGHETGRNFLAIPHALGRRDVVPAADQRPQKRLMIAGEGTHTPMMEKNRTTLISAVQKFLEEDFTN
jgi:hypothetical protein